MDNLKTHAASMKLEVGDRPEEDHSHDTCIITILDSVPWRETYFSAQVQPE